MKSESRNAKGAGSFKKNQDGTITHRKSVGYKANGNRKILTVTAETKAACIKEMRKKELAWEKEKKNTAFSEKVTVEELCKMHLLYQVNQGELKPKSIDRRECTIEKHIGEYDLGKMQVKSVKSSDVDTHINGLINAGKLSYSSIEKALDVLNAAYNWAVLFGKLESNPVSQIKANLSKRINKIKNKSAEDADVVVLTEEEIELFRKAALSINTKTGKYEYPAGVYGLLLLYTGMRCGEMIALRWRDVDFENSLLKIEKSQSMAKNRKGGEEDKKYIAVEGTTKNEKAREIRLKPEALEILQIIRESSRHTEADDLVITTKSGKANTATNLEHRMATIFKNAGLVDYTGALHIFRRTFATQMYEEGARVKDIAAYIGDLASTTEQYYIAARKKVKVGDKSKHIVELPKAKG